MFFLASIWKHTEWTFLIFMLSHINAGVFLWSHWDLALLAGSSSRGDPPGGFQTDWRKAEFCAGWGGPGVGATCVVVKPKSIGDDFAASAVESEKSQNQWVRTKQDRWTMRRRRFCSHFQSNRFNPRDNILRSLWSYSCPTPLRNSAALFLCYL